MPKEPFDPHALPFLLQKWADSYGMMFMLTQTGRGDPTWGVTWTGKDGQEQTLEGYCYNRKVHLAQDACMQADEEWGHLLGRVETFGIKWEPPQHGHVSEWLEGE